MRFNKVLMITPPARTFQGPLRPNAGIGYLAEILFQNNIHYAVLDMMLGYNLDDLHKRIEKFKPDLLVISMFSEQYKKAYALLQLVKENNPSLQIIAGGPHVSCFQEKVLEECGAIDFGVFLEGEYALLELCKGKKLCKIGNLIYRDRGEIITNPPGKFIDNLDLLHFPTYTGFELQRYIDEKAIVSSRGCPYRCIYCAVGKVSGRKVRARSAKNIVDEIEYWHKKGFQQFSFQDDNFTFYQDRVYEICDEIEGRGLMGLFLRCAGARADKLSYSLLKRMKEVGFRTIAIGVEVGNDRMLRVIKKGEKFADIDVAVRDACRLGFDVYLNFLFGAPSETIADVNDSIKFARKYPVFMVGFSNIIPYPGTELNEWAHANNRLLIAEDVYLNSLSTHGTEPVFDTIELPLKERKKLWKLIRKTESEVLRKAFFRRMRKIPFGLRHLLAFTLSSGLIRKQLFQNNLRKLADRARFWLYQS